MSGFEDREREFDKRFADDEDMKFRLIARRNRLLGEWAAHKMQLTEAERESYTKDVIRADFEDAGDESVIRKVLGDLTAAGVDSSDEEIREALQQNAFEAKRQLVEARGGVGG